MADESSRDRPMTIRQDASLAASQASLFSQLVESRREWIETHLRPWCRRAARRELLLAETEWTDLAGTPEPETSLWTWAWSRFPNLIHERLNRIDETREVTVELSNGNRVSGYPDGRSSHRGMLVLLVSGAGGIVEEAEPISIDDITAVRIGE